MIRAVTSVNFRERSLPKKERSKRDLSTFTPFSTVLTPLVVFIRPMTVYADKLGTSHWLLKTVSTFFRTGHKSSDVRRDRSKLTWRKSCNRSSLRSGNRLRRRCRSSKDSGSRNRRRSWRATKMRG